MTSESDPVHKDNSENDSNRTTAQDSGQSNTPLPPTVAAPPPNPPSPASYQITCNRKRDWIDRIEFGMGIVGLLVLIGYAIFTAGMYYANKRAADAAKSAADTAACALRDSQGQFQATLGEMQTQTQAQQDAAGAAKDAAITANAALHVSERAYIAVGFPILDPTNMTASLPLSNSGHIPSGPVEIIVHELTVDGTPSAPTLSVTERHWKKFPLASITPGSSLTGRDIPGILIPLPAASMEKLSGSQRVAIAGRITYNDGFPEDRSIVLPFCSQTTYHIIEKQVVWIPCDPAVMIPQMESLDGYPNNEQQP